ncbi:MAG: glycosyltransferase family 4 protein [bacterium]
MKKIVVLSQVFHPDTQATSQLFSDLFQKLTGNDFHVRVICGFPAVVDKTVPCPAFERWGGIEIHRCGCAFNFKKSLWRRALHYLSFSLAASRKLLQNRDCDFVFGLTNPPFMPVWLWLLQKIGKFRYQLMLLDVYPDGLEGLKKISRRHVFFRFWRAINRRAFRRAEKIFVLGRDMKKLIHERYGVPDEKIIYAPHWSAVEIKEPKKAEDSALCAKLGLQGKFILQYSGNMGLWHDIETIVRTAALLQSREGIHFLMIGDGMRKAAAHSLAREMRLANMTWLPFQPKETLEDSLTCCHAALISQREGLQGVAVPCKLYGILASGRAIIGMVPSGSEIDLVIQEENCGVTTPPHAPDHLAQVILHLFQNPKKVREMGERAFASYQQKYTVDVAVKNFIEAWH